MYKDRGPIGGDLMRWWGGSDCWLLRCWLSDSGWISACKGLKHCERLAAGMIADRVSFCAGFTCIADDDGKTAQHAVNNMLQHLHHVASTWSRVLPTNAYYKSVGTFCRYVRFFTENSHLFLLYCPLAFCQDYFIERTWIDDTVLKLVILFHSFIHTFICP